MDYLINELKVIICEYVGKGCYNVVDYLFGEQAINYNYLCEFYEDYDVKEYNKIRYLIISQSDNLNKYKNILFLKLSEYFDKSINTIIFPNTLQKLTIHNDFNESILENVLPPNLGFLEFGTDFDQPIKKMCYQIL